MYYIKLHSYKSQFRWMVSKAFGTTPVMGPVGGSSSSGVGGNQVGPITIAPANIRH